MNKNNDATEDTIIVFKDEYDVNDMTCPGYTLLNGNLNYEGVIDEDFAWDNEVWVIGEAEFLSQKPIKFVDENPNSGGTRPNTSLTRLEGRAEYGGIIQITNRGAVEPWYNGKFEMKYMVFSATGAKIKEKAFGKTRRKHFKNNNWVDYNDFIANWNTSNIGNFMIEAWIEEDGGCSTTISQSFSAPCTGCPSTSVSYTVGKRDETLGQSIVQFSDNLNQIYGISYSNFKRK